MLLAAFLSLKPSSGSKVVSQPCPGSNFLFLGIGFSNSKPASSAVCSKSEISVAANLFCL